MLRYLLLMSLTACALESGSTAITSSDIQEYNPIYVQNDQGSTLI